MIDRHLASCESLNGVISERILKSIFDPHSTGHDGAVVIEKDIIRSFGCHLPLSKNSELMGITGTRHAAALGLSELTDAICFVVSEERGTISVARHGRIDEVDGTERLSQVLDSFYQEFQTDKESIRWKEFFRRNYREKILAVSLALALWFVLVHESRIVYRTFNIPVQSPELFSGLVVTQTEPEKVEVTLSGQRKSFYFMDEDDVRLSLKPWQLEAGRSRIRLLSSDFTVPEGLEYEDSVPREVTVTVESKTSQAGETKE
jgi:hypothetical protein